jgi:multidrug efflux pump subunit AcrA (membrane-fusion protein)
MIDNVLFGKGRKAMKKIKIKKKVVIPIVIILALAGAGTVYAQSLLGAAKARLPAVSASPLERTDISTTVNVTGNIKSDEITNVYSTLPQQVLKVNVKVGDRVSAGDVLAELDTADLMAQIALGETRLEQARAGAQHGLNVAVKNLETVKFNQENGYDTGLTQAELAVERAKQQLESAELNLYNAQIGERALRRQMRDYTGTDVYQDIRENDLFDSTLDGANGLRTQLRQTELNIDGLENAVEAAKQGVKDAQDALVATQVLNKEAVISSNDAVTQARLGTDMTAEEMTLEQQRKDLEKAIIKAPASGTVTSVFAKQGNTGTGLLFVIENTEKLIVTTRIEEYDLPNVEVGQPVIIKSDGTGDEEYEGSVTRIAPTAVKNIQGETMDTTKVQFETDIGVAQGTKLKIGMNARLEIVTEAKTGVFAIPYDSLLEKDDGSMAAYIARPNPAATDGTTTQTYTIAEIPVTLGLETDLSVEVEGALQEGDLVVSSLDSLTLTDGMQVTLTAENAGAAAPEGGMQVAFGL